MSLGGEKTTSDYRCPDCNVILIVVDALRPDHLGCYGYARNTSPNIDNLAKEGVLFENAIAQGGETAVSVPSIITSLYPWSHGVYNFSYNLSDSATTLSEVLGNHGYTTAGITDHPVMFDSNFNQGCDHTATFDYLDSGVNLSWYLTGWINDHKNEKFFLWVHYFGPHGPYTPPPPYDKKFVNDEFYYEKRKELKTEIPWWQTVGNITDVNFYLSQYDGEIANTDEQIGAMMHELNRLNLTNNTIVIITADHGEAFDELDEQGFLFDHGMVYDVILKVPLIIMAPGDVLRGRIEKQARSIDIMPTVLDLLNISVDTRMDGLSLMPLIFGENGSRISFSYSDDGMTAARTDGWKYVLPDKLYNLVDDPLESRNVIYNYPEKAAELRDELSEYLLTVASYPTNGTELSHETKEKLRSLGYLT